MKSFETLRLFNTCSQLKRLTLSNSHLPIRPSHPPPSSPATFDLPFWECWDVVWKTGHSSTIYSIMMISFMFISVIDTGLIHDSSPIGQRQLAQKLHLSLQTLWWKCFIFRVVWWRRASGVFHQMGYIVGRPWLARLIQTIDTVTTPPLASSQTQLC